MNFSSNSQLVRKLHATYNIFPDYEKILEINYRSLIRPGDTVIDIGAHLGRHTRCFAELVGDDGLVLAFEPLPTQFDELKNRFPGPPVFLVNNALSDIPGRSSFVYAQGTPEESGLKQRVRYNFPEKANPVTIEVEVDVLDSYIDAIRGPLSFVKIDTEGAEVAIISGGRQLIDKFRPIISAEYGHAGYAAWGQTRETLFEVSQAIGYRISDLFGAICPNLQAWEAADLSFWDWLLVPVERVPEWTAKMEAPG